MKTKVLFILFQFLSTVSIGQNSLLKSVPTTTSLNSQIRNPVEIFGTLYFFQNSINNYYTLFRSNGTNLGTVPVKDPETDPTAPKIYAEANVEMIQVNNNLFYLGTTGPAGYYGYKYEHNLCVSNGTAPGTVELITTPSFSTPHKLTKFGNNKCIFLASQDFNGAYNNYFEPYISDGTVAGTFLLKDINPNGGSQISEFIEYNGIMYFWADDGTHGIELWRTDGTPSGTYIVEDFVAGPAGSSASTSNPIIKGESNLYFSITSPTEGTELASCNGNYISLHPLPNGPVNTYPTQLTPFGLNIAFTTTAGGLKKLFAFNGFGFNEISTGLTNPKDLIAVGQALFFTAFDNQGIGIFRYIAGNFAIKAGDINTQPYVNGVDDTFPPYTTENNQRIFIEHNYNLYFVAQDGINGYQLWQLNGGSLPTFINQYTAINTSGSTKFAHFTKTNNSLYFLAKDSQNYDMYRLDIFSSNLSSFSNFYHQEPFTDPYPLIGDYVNNLYFVGHNETSGFELYKTTGNTTHLIKDINNFMSDESLGPTFDLPSSNATHTIYTGYNTRFGSQLYTTTGKTAQTRLLMDAIPYPIDEKKLKMGDFTGGSLPYSKAHVFNNEFYFILDDKVWKTDGVNPPVVLIENSNIPPPSFSYLNSKEYRAEIFNGLLYFTYNNNLYKTNGSTVTLVYTPNSIIQYLTLAGNKLFFYDKNNNGFECIYKIEPSSDVPIQVKQFGYFNIESSQNFSFYTNGIELFFWYLNATSSGFNLWKSDGTEVGTLPIHIPIEDSYIRIHDGSNGLLYFSIGSYVSPQQGLWRSDGSTVGTFKLKDGEVYKIFPFKEKTYFFLGENSTYNLYSTNGTVIGTQVALNILPNDGSYLYPASNSMVFTDYNTVTQQTLAKKWSGFIGSTVETFTLSGNKSIEYLVNAHSGSGLVYMNLLMKENINGNDTFFNEIHVFKDCYIDYYATGNVNSNNVSEATQKIKSTQKLLLGTSNDYLAHKSIELNPGFEAKSGSIFKAQIQGCNHNTD